MPKVNGTATRRGPPTDYAACRGPLLPIPGQHNRRTTLPLATRGAAQPHHLMPLVIDIRNADDVRDIVHRAVQALVEGQLVAFPTETVYGIGASARRADAVERLRKVKGRRAGAPFALAIRSAEEAFDYVPDMLPIARRLARRCWPGPVTLVVENKHRDRLTERLPHSVQEAVSPSGTLGLRVPAGGVLLEVLRLLAGPIALTSANRGGEAESVTAEDVVQALGDDVPLVLNDGRCRYGQPSSVVSVRKGKVKVLREGVVGVATLRRLANLMVLFVCTGNTCRSPMAELLMRGRLASRLKCNLEELEQRGVLVASAGVAAAPGGGPTAEAVEAMRDEGLDLSQHESQPLTEQLVRHADRILTMTASQRQMVVDRWPDAAGRTFVLMPNGSDIVDPIGQAVDAYRHCAAQIKTGIEHQVAQLQAELRELSVTSWK